MNKSKPLCARALALLCVKIANPAIFKYIVHIHKALAPLIQGGPLGYCYLYIFHISITNYACRLRLEKLLYVGPAILHVGPARSFNGHFINFKPFLDPGGGFTSETAADSRSETVVT
jgi:hypothetical protein